MNTNTYFFKSRALGDGIVLDITNGRREALLNAVEKCMNAFYGQKVKYADGVTRYPWERKPYEQIIEELEKLPDDSKTVRYFGGFYCIVKNSLKHLAYKDAICADMICEIEEAEEKPQPEK